MPPFVPKNFERDGFSFLNSANLNPIIARSILKKSIKLLFPAPFPPISTLMGFSSSWSKASKDLKPLIVIFCKFMVSVYSRHPLNSDNRFSII